MTETAQETPTPTKDPAPPPTDSANALSFKDELIGLPVWGKALAIAMCTYILTVSVQRFSQCMDPWVAETDWKQWVWQYWRYHIPGAFPEGHVITDYTFNAQPPLYHVVMATLSRVFVPVTAANIVNWFSWALALWACVVAVRRRTHLLVGLAVAMLFVHDDGLHRITMGGYPRSFGPTLTLLFLAAWLNGRHRLVLLVLLCGAAIYPSVCVPAGLTYGLWTLATAPRTSLKAWLRPNLEVIATGVALSVIAMWQSVTAPSWWGPVVWAKDAGVSLTSQGRTAWLPLDAFGPTVKKYMQEPWHFSGNVWVKSLPFSQDTAHNLGQGAAVVVALVGAALIVRNALAQQRRPGLNDFRGALQMVLVALCAIFSFYLARELAFKLYLPRRMVQHTIPSILFVGLGLLYFTTGLLLLKSRLRAAVFVVVALVGPQLAFSGDGFGPSGYHSYARNEKLYRWIMKNTKVTDQFGGYYRILDEIPFFAARQVYVNWKMAHPFRQGFFDEIDRRTVVMYDAYFATDLHQLQSFMHDKDVAYFVVNEGTFDKLEGGDSQLFEPMRSKILKTIFKPRLGRFALKSPPKQIVAFQQGAIRVLSRDKLDAYLLTQPASTPTTTDPTDPTTAPTTTQDSDSPASDGNAED